MVMDPSSRPRRRPGIARKSYELPESIADTIAELTKHYGCDSEQEFVKRMVQFMRTHRADGDAGRPWGYIDEHGTFVVVKVVGG